MKENQKNTKEKKVRQNKTNRAIKPADAFDNKTTKFKPVNKKTNSKNSDSQERDGGDKKRGEKAYKILAQQRKISNNEAKKLIDNGLVSIGGRRITIARADVAISTKFSIREIEAPKKIFEDIKILVINKPSMMTSDEVEEILKKNNNEIFLLNRLDRETSGILLFGKNEEFQKEVIAEFKAHRVYKEYVAWVDGKLSESMTIDKKLKKVSGEGQGRVVVAKDGVEAITEVEPISIYGNKTKLKVIIKTGRTHQIRAHLSSIGFPIVGDVNYGGMTYDRILLHSKKVEFLGYSFEVEEPKSFDRFLNINN